MLRHKRRCKPFVRGLFAFALILLCAEIGLGEDPWKLAVGDYDPVVSITVSSDSAIAAVGYRDNTIRLWDLTSGRELRRLVGHDHPPESLSFSPDGKRLLSSAPRRSPGNMRLWSVETGENLFAFVAPRGISHVAFHPSGLCFAAHARQASAGQPMTAITYWDAKTFKVIAATRTDDEQCSKIQFSPDGRLLAVQTLHAMRLWDVQAATWKKVARGDHMAFSPDGRCFAISASRDVILLDCATLHEVRRFTAPREHNENTQVMGIQFTPNGRQLCVATSRKFCLWEIGTGELAGTIASRDEHFAITPDGRLLLTPRYGGHLHALDLANGESVARFIARQEEDQWLVETAAGYFDFGGNVRPRVGSIAAGRDAGEYVAKYRRPDMVTRILTGMKAADAERLSQGHRPPKVVVKLSNTGAEQVTIEISAQAFGPGTAVARASVSVNDRDLEATRLKDEATEPRNASTRRWQAEVLFPPGENTATVRAVAYDNLGQKSEIATLVVERPVKVATVSGRLFVLAVGVSSYRKPEYNLDFCHADAKELAGALAAQRGRAFGDVQVQVFTDKQATVTNVEDGLGWLQRSCTPADVAVVFFAGHGIRAERGLYYMTHEANVNGLQYTCLNWETVAQAVKNTRARQMIFLADTCHAGAFGEATFVPQQELAASLVKLPGVHVLASSRGEEASLESPDWQHGAFCKAILEALAGKADADGDGKVTIGEIHDYTSRRVAELTGGKQHPYLPRQGRFDPHLVLAHGNVLPGR